jgi:hypothetical protein
MLRVLQLESAFIAVSALSLLGGSPSTLFYLMASSNFTFDEKLKNIPSTNSSSSGNPGTSGSAASFYHVNLDKGQRKLSGVQVQMYVRSRCLIHVSS